MTLSRIYLGRFYPPRCYLCRYAVFYLIKKLDVNLIYKLLNSHCDYLDVM